MATKRAAKKAPKTAETKPVARPAKKPSASGVGLPDLRKLFDAHAGVEEGTSYGTVAWKVRKKLLARMKEDGVTLVVRAPFDLRDALIESDAQTFFITDHYANYPAVLVRLARVRRAELAALVAQAVEFVGGPARASRA